MRCSIVIIFITMFFSQEHFSDIPENTGISHMIVIENITGLEIGDEVGLFDANGLINWGDCSNQYGELLVGAAVYDGEQLNIVGIGSLDTCEFPDGYQLSGWVDSNPIIIKVWDASEDVEYMPEVIYNEGSDNWGNNFSVVNLIVHQLAIEDINHISLYDVYPNPFNSTITLDIKNVSSSDLIISIFDIYGALVESLNFQSIYEQKIYWDASDYKSGIYFINFKSSDSSITKKISLIK